MWIVAPVVEVRGMVGGRRFAIRFAGLIRFWLKGFWVRKKRFKYVSLYCYSNKV
jgi:hypothetical protein